MGQGIGGLEVSELSLTYLLLFKVSYHIKS